MILFIGGLMVKGLNPHTLMEIIKKECDMLASSYSYRSYAHTKSPLHMYGQGKKIFKKNNATC